MNHIELVGWLADRLNIDHATAEEIAEFSYMQGMNPEAIRATYEK